MVEQVGNRGKRLTDDRRLTSRRSRHLCATALALAATPLPAYAQNAPSPAPAKPADKSQDIVVTGQRSDVTASPDRTSFNIANDLHAQTGSLADALRAVPGVEVDLQGNVRMRGDAGVTILIDGRPSAMLRGDARGDYLLAAPAAQIERVEIISNPSAAFSPEGSAGIINLVTKQVRQSARFATLRAAAGTEGRAGLGASGVWTADNLTLTGELNHNRMDLEIGQEQERSRLDTGTGTFLDSRQDSELEGKARASMARAGAEYDMDKVNRISGEVSYRRASNQSSRLDRYVGPADIGSFVRSADNDVHNSDVSLRGSWRRTLPGKDHQLTADLSFSQSRFRRVLDGVSTMATGSSADRTRNAFDRTDYGVKVDYKKPASGSGSLNLGYQFDRITNSFDNQGLRGPLAGPLVPVAALTNRFDFSQDVHALYATRSLQTGRFSVQPGLRLDGRTSRSSRPAAAGVWRMAIHGSIPRCTSATSSPRAKPCAAAIAAASSVPRHRTSIPRHCSSIP